MLQEQQPPNFDYHSHRETKVNWIVVPSPPIGSKIACIKGFGMYVLEAGPTLWRGMMCTHPGSGGYAVYDGVPDENGFFQQTSEYLEKLAELEHRERFADENWKLSSDPTLTIELLEILKAVKLEKLAHMSLRNGREVAFANPAVMGMWMFDAGLFNGLTLKCEAEHQEVMPIISITWQPQKKR